MGVTPGTLACRLRLSISVACAPCSPSCGSGGR
jgi:hypothetical protein